MLRTPRQRGFTAASLLRLPSTSDAPGTPHFRGVPSMEMAQLDWLLVTRERVWISLAFPPACPFPTHGSLDWPRSPQVWSRGMRKAEKQNCRMTLLLCKRGRPSSLVSLGEWFLPTYLYGAQKWRTGLKNNNYIENLKCLARSSCSWCHQKGRYLTLNL